MFLASLFIDKDQNESTSQDYMINEGASSSTHVQQDENDSDATVISEETVLELSNDSSSCEHEEKSPVKKVKRRKISYSDKKLIAKMMDKKGNDNMKANTEITYALDKLEEMIPTLSPTSALTPIIKNLFILTKNINFKLNERDNVNETKFPLTRNISTTKVKGKVSCDHESLLENPY